MALDLPAARVDGHWVRHGTPGAPALPRRDPAPDSRWQRGTVVDALYLADTEATMWAEWYRHLAELAIPPLAQMPRLLWTWNVEAEVADLSTPELLATVALKPPTPGRSGWRKYQRVGERLAREGWAGLLAPSAARPSGRVLCLFRREDGVAGASPMKRPRKVKAPPPPPLGLRT